MDRKKMIKEYTELCDILQTKIASKCKNSNIIIFGDMDAKIQNINNNNFKQRISKNGELLNNVIKTTNLENMNDNTDEPTFISANGKHKSIIDYVFESKPNRVKIKNIEIDYDDIYRVYSKRK